jgi:4-diphosphocytidyl-2-C-methyl-D-erythritol kinase
MYLRREHLKRTGRAPAKLNLYLEVWGERGDGFHELETLMMPICLFDHLTFEPIFSPESGRLAEIQLDVHSCLPVRPPPRREDVPLDGSNLVVRALERLRERSGCSWGAKVGLIKRIPTAAGLAGASSDAATALRLANRAWQLNWSPDRLAEIAAEIGSDVPFFVYGASAICRGRGERIDPLREMPTLHFVVVVPGQALKTADVYQAHDKLPENMPRAHAGAAVDIATALQCRYLHKAVAGMHNRLQAAAATLSTWVERIRAVFEKLDCLAHQLSGSGSAYFGICRHALHARRLATLLRTQQLGHVYPTRSYR